MSNSEKPAEQPYGKAEVGNTIATNVINELYVNFNGSIHYGWSILDNLTMQWTDTAGSNWTSADNFAGAMKYWRPNQQEVHYKNGNQEEGALFATNKTAGKHNKLGDYINSANKHLVYQYSKSEAFSPNTGKDNYVAELVVSDDGMVSLYIYQVEGGNKRYVRGTNIGKNPYVGDASNKTNVIWNWEYDAMFDIAAGDMDGDGYDEIAVYTATGTGSDDQAVHLYKYTGGTLTEITKKTVTKPNNNNAKDKNLKLGTAVVTLAFGDLNADDKDELVIAENMTYGSSNINDGKVGIYALKEGALERKKEISLETEREGNNVAMARYVNVATGDIDNDNQDELIIAGYVGIKAALGSTNISGTNKDNIYYKIIDGKEYKESDWKTTSFVKKDLLGRVVDNSSQLIPPVSLTCAATQGVGYAEQLFLSGCLYSVNKSNYELTLLTQISTNREYKKDNGNKANKEEIFVVNVVAGNFNGNRNGQEQIVYAFGMKHDDSDRYWYDIGYINKKAPGPENANQSSGYWYGQEQVMNYESSYNRDQNKSRASLYLSLAAVDCDNDSTLMRYKGQTVTWTKPEVLTILQSAPYFQDLQDTRDYINQGQTGYGKGSSSSSSAIAGTSLKVGTYVSFEQDFSVFGVKVASIQAEAQSTHEFEYEFQSTKEKSIEVRYSGSAGDDYAVVYAVPYMEYQYETWVPGYTVTDDNLNTYIAQKLGKEEGAVTPEERAKVKQEFGITVGTKVEGSWQPSSVMVPMKPATVLITVDDYDAIAEQTEGLEPIRGNILNSTHGRTCDL
ncbi:MAG: FG-GAP repeat domain-containing protein [Evtepia sp.]